MVSHDASEIKDWSNGCWKFNFDKKEMHFIWKYFQIENIICKITVFLIKQVQYIFSDLIVKHFYKYNILHLTYLINILSQHVNLKIHFVKLNFHGPLILPCGLLSSVWKTFGLESRRKVCLLHDKC